MRDLVAWVAAQQLTFRLYSRILPQWAALALTVVTALAGGAVLYRLVKRAKPSSQPGS